MPDKKDKKKTEAKQAVKTSSAKCNFTAYVAVSDVSLDKYAQAYINRTHLDEIHTMDEWKDIVDKHIKESKEA